MATIDDRVATVEAKIAVHDVKIDGLAKESTMIQMFADLRADMSKEFAALRAEISPMKSDIAAIQSKLNHKPSTERMYLAIGGALVLGLGAVFAMFSYMVPPLR